MQNTRSQSKFRKILDCLWVRNFCNWVFEGLFVTIVCWVSVLCSLKVKNVGEFRGLVSASSAIFGCYVFLL